MSKFPARKSTSATTARKSSGPTPNARKTAPRPSAARPAPGEEPADTSTPPRVAKNILSVGIKALANAHGEVVARQSRVFESLLGLGHVRDKGGDKGGDKSGDKSGDRSRETSDAAGDKPLAATALDPFGFKKFEDVFDQRVARTLQRLDVPSAQAFADLVSEVEHLRKELARLQPSGKKR